MRCGYLLQVAPAIWHPMLCERLLDGEYQVTVVDNLICQQNNLFHLCDNPRFVFLRRRARRVLMKACPASGRHNTVSRACRGPSVDRDLTFARSANLESVRLVNRLRSPRQLVVYLTTNSGYGTKTGDVGYKPLGRGFSHRRTSG